MIQRRTLIITAYLQHSSPILLLQRFWMKGKELGCIGSFVSGRKKEFSTRRSKSPCQNIFDKFARRLPNIGKSETFCGHVVPDEAARFKINAL